MLVTLNVAHLDFQRYVVATLTRSRQSPLGTSSLLGPGNCMNPRSPSRGAFPLLGSRIPHDESTPGSLRNECPGRMPRSRGHRCGNVDQFESHGVEPSAAVGAARSVVSVAADTTDTAMRFKRCSASARPFNCSGSYRRVNPGVGITTFHPLRSSMSDYRTTRVVRIRNIPTASPNQLVRSGHPSRPTACKPRGRRRAGSRHSIWGALCADSATCCARHLSRPRPTVEVG